MKKLPLLLISDILSYRGKCYSWIILSLFDACPFDQKLNWSICIWTKIKVTLCERHHMKKLEDKYPTKSIYKKKGGLTQKIKYLILKKKSNSRLWINERDRHPTYEKDRHPTFQITKIQNHLLVNSFAVRYFATC